MSIVIATRTRDALRVPDNDERRAEWAARYYGAGLHRDERRRRAMPSPHVRPGARP